MSTPYGAVDSRRRTARNAQIYTITVVTLAILALLVTVGLVAGAGGECGTDETYFECHETARYVVTLVPTSLFLLGALGAFVRTYQVWRHKNEWRMWHAAGWALFVAMLIYIGVAGSFLAMD
ncbi:hypothetical protein [Antrihabitans sp. YC2-6]|uniref:hypothetical protein n=1 Tax=Antrihabitans sp. YC2-6 TaxID=2799498 RepID=UPI0018F62C76|nr:hypothetical protein [Antrihabitans sp. YC2-6]MBJ8343178.1 hypothetical protein [Antrihabitans sp. YC2-6]